MSQELAAPRPAQRSSFGGLGPGQWAALAVLVHAIIWAFGPLLFLHSVHQDTLEIIYWSHEPALGYFKHPPLAVWIVDAALRIGGQTPLLTLMLLGQLTIAIAAAYIFATLRLFATPAAAALGVFCFIASPAATYYAVQVNHNSLLLPFWSAALFYGLRYLERLDWRDAIALGLAAGLGALTKYEILLLLVGLLLLAALVPRYRRAFARPASYLCFGLFIVILSPHLWWLTTHPGTSISYAVDSRPIAGAGDVIESLNNAFVGNLVLAIGPALVGIGLWLVGQRVGINRDRALLAGVVALTPSVGLFVLSLATLQVFRQGWTLPFTPSVVVGAALVFESRLRTQTAASTPSSAGSLSWRMMLLSAGQLALFFLLIWGRAERGPPIAAYDIDARQFASRVAEFWGERQKAPLACLFIDNELTASAPILYLGGRPRVVDLAEPFWSRPEQREACRQSGAVAILAHGESLASIPSICADSLRSEAIAAPVGNGRFTWKENFYYVPPAGQACG